MATSFDDVSHFHVCTGANRYAMVGQTCHEVDRVKTDLICSDTSDTHVSAAAKSCGMVGQAHHDADDQAGVCCVRENAPRAL